MIIPNMYIIYTDSLSWPWPLPPKPSLENQICPLCWISHSCSCSQHVGSASSRRTTLSTLFLYPLCCSAAANPLSCCLCPGTARRTQAWRCSLISRSQRTLSWCQNLLCCPRGGIGSLHAVFLSISRIRGWKDRDSGSCLRTESGGEHLTHK